MAMANDATESDEVLVLADQEGNYYAIPRETLERHRVPEERKAELERQLGIETDDVAGHSMYNHFVTQQLVDQRHAEFLQEARDAQIARLATGGQSESGSGLGAGAVSPTDTNAIAGGAFFGRFIRMMRAPRLGARSIEA